MIVVDEAAMVGTRTLARVLDHASVAFPVDSREQPLMQRRANGTGFGGLNAPVSWRMKFAV